MSNKSNDSSEPKRGRGRPKAFEGTALLAVIASLQLTQSLTATAREIEAGEVNGVEAKKVSLPTLAKVAKDAGVTLSRKAKGVEKPKVVRREAIASVTTGELCELSDRLEGSDDDENDDDLYGDGDVDDLLDGMNLSFGAGDEEDGRE